jgi:ribonuclease P protein subunit POP4
VRGIVVKDSKFTFEIVTKKDQVKTMPKEHTIFRFTVPYPVKEGEEEKDSQEGEKKEFVFELHGDQFVYRAADRANRKFKSRFHTDL